MRIPDIVTYIQQRPGTSALIAFNAIPALEMAIRAIGNIVVLSRGKDPDAWNELGGNLFGVIWLTPCALEVFPGARLCGAVSFIFYSYFKGTQDKPLITAKKVAEFMTLLFMGFVFVRQNPIKTVVACVGTYLLFTQAKTSSIFSKVWRQE